MRDGVTAEHWWRTWVPNLYCMFGDGGVAGIGGIEQSPLDLYRSLVLWVAGLSLFLQIHSLIRPNHHEHNPYVLRSYKHRLVFHEYGLPILLFNVVWIYLKSITPLRLYLQISSLKSKPGIRGLSHVYEIKVH